MIFDFIDIAKIRKKDLTLVNNDFSLDVVIEDTQKIFQNQLAI
jgi:hypothetical protein